MAWPSLAAYMRAVSPERDCTSVSAPCCTSRLAASSWPKRAAIINGVCPAMLGRSGSALDERGKHGARTAHERRTHDAHKMYARRTLGTSQAYADKRTAHDRRMQIARVTHA
eukprot:270939-Pleurochrysis_carterae.AAC.1